MVEQTYKTVPKEFMKFSPSQGTFVLQERIPKRLTKGLKMSYNTKSLNGCPKEASTAHPVRAGDKLPCKRGKPRTNAPDPGSF